MILRILDTQGCKPQIAVFFGLKLATSPPTIQQALFGGTYADMADRFVVRKKYVLIE
jgi:hypothetical protein